MTLIEKALQKYGQAFVDKVGTIAQQLGTTTNVLLFIMNHESGINHTAVNSIGCGGLIGFCPISFANLNIASTQALLSMSAMDQLDKVLQYYQYWKRAGIYTGGNAVETSLVTFYPYAVKKINDDEYIFGSEKSTEWAKTVRNQNHIFDLDGDGFIKMSEYKKYICDKFTAQTGEECGTLNIGFTTISIDEKKNPIC